MVWKYFPIFFKGYKWFIIRKVSVVNIFVSFIFLVLAACCRLNSNSSNYSGDSGAPSQDRETPKEPLQEREYESLRSLSTSQPGGQTSSQSIYELLPRARGSSRGEPPQPPPRFATIRKSHTLSSGMSASVEGVPGLEGVREDASLVTESGLESDYQTVKLRPRPSSLCVSKSSHLRPVVVPGSLPATPSGLHTPGSRTRSPPHSAPHMTRCCRSLQRGCAPEPPLRLRKTGLSTSTPQNLDNLRALSQRARVNAWRSNDGLTTPVSFDGSSPYQTPGESPAMSPR